MIKKIADRITELREDAGKTQNEIAKLLKTTPQYYSTYERGIRDITTERLIILAEYYNVSMDYITCRTDTKNIKDKLEPEEYELLKEFRSLTREGKARLKERAMMIAETEAEESAATRGRKSS